MFLILVYWYNRFIGKLIFHVMLLISKLFGIPINNIVINLQRDATKRTLFVSSTCAKRWLLGGVRGGKLPLFRVFFKYLNRFVWIPSSRTLFFVLDRNWVCFKCEYWLILKLRVFNSSYPLCSLNRWISYCFLINPHNKFKKLDMV